MDSFQMPVPAPSNRDRVPADLKRQTNAELALESENTDAAKPSEGEKAAEDKDSETQPVRVIFVFRQLADVDSK